MYSKKANWLRKPLAAFMALVMILSLVSVNMGAKTAKAADNIIQNADFSNGTNLWTTYVGNDWAGSSATFTPIAGSGISINIGAVGNSEWGIQLYQDGIPYTNGTTYKVSFDLESTMSKMVNTYIQDTQADGTWIADLGSASSLVTAGNKRTVEITTSQMNNLTNLRFVMSFGRIADGDRAGTIRITNIQMVPTQASQGGSGTGEYELVWSDEFNGNSLDRSNGVNEFGASGWGNNE